MKRNLVPLQFAIEFPLYTFVHIRPLKSGPKWINRVIFEKQVVRPSPFTNKAVERSLR
jgi:hypothetical protein